MHVQLKNGEREVIEGQKQVHRLEGELRRQTMQYESVRSERTLFARNLVEAQSEVLKMEGDTPSYAGMCGGVGEGVEAARG